MHAKQVLHYVDPQRRQAYGSLLREVVDSHDHHHAKVIGMGQFH